MLSPEYGARHPARLEPEQEQLACPRCESTDTKFCYYNNYNLSQPRHYCKSCRRYWTRGGSLRNVPVGGNKRSTRTTPPGCETAKPGPVTDVAPTAEFNLNENVHDCDTWQVEGGDCYRSESDPAKGFNL